MKTRAAIASLIAVGVVAALLSVSGPHSSAEAADGSQFDPGNIISDSMFFDGSAMSAAAAQSFLSAKRPTCRSGYTCLPQYKQNTPNVAATSGRCAAYSGAAAESAATIIAKVGAACGVSQKVLIVLLEKEQSLVTDDWPSSTQYAKATGYSCPDTAACDPAYAGFFYQVYHAARQFKSYAASPGSWNHQAGRVNYVRYHPDSSCGSSAVFIANQATAGLYNYTPYQPNAAALANLYGTGDRCSAYGNRNFWRIFTDWFGSPTAGTSLLKTSADATVYLVSGTVKHPIPSFAILQALAPLGAVGVVSQAVIDRYTTAHPVGRTIRGGDGTIYFFDAGIKLGITSCAQALDYGASCAADGYVQLTDAQIAAFRTGPNLLPVLATTAGNRYYIKDATKREILDDQAQALAGIPPGFNVLTEGAVATLALGTPIMRDSVYFNERGTNNFNYLSGGVNYGVPGQALDFGIPARNNGVLSTASVRLIPKAPFLFNGVVAKAGSTSAFILNNGRKLPLGLGVGGATLERVVPMTDALLNTYAAGTTLAPGSLIKTPANATVYVVMPTEIKPVGSWAALIALSPGTPVITTVPNGAIAAFPQGNVALTTGSLVRSPGDATIWLINGVTSRIPVSSFEMTKAAGITAWEVFPQDRIDAYPPEPKVLGFGLGCGGNSYVTAGGSLHLIPKTLVGLYPIEFIALDTFTCRIMKIGSPATRFIRTPDGSIYYLSGGQKLPISSMSRFAQLGGLEAGYLTVAGRMASLIPTGPSA